MQLSNQRGNKALKACAQLFAVCSFLLIINFSASAQKNNVLPHSLPEKQGVSAAAIDSFINATGHSAHEFHSIVFLRHGKVVAEGWWKPYGETLKHALYSTSKSFTSTAVGFAVSENKLKVTDKVISFFPNSLPDTISPYLAQLTVKNLLTMSAGMEPDPTYRIPFGDNWVKAFLATPIVNQPGTKFLYNTMATFMLSAIVQKVTGQKEIDYLKPRLFGPLGISGEDWEVSNDGINTGGWGLRLKTEEMAKLGQLYLQKGVWNGKQLLPKAWVEEATTFKIDQAPGVAQSKRDSSDWMQGYCYQFWRCRNNAFRADGAFGQYIIVMPDKDAVIAITCESPNMQDEIDLVWKYLLPSMHDGVLPMDKNADATLARDLNKLNLPPLQNKIAHPAAAVGSAVKTYTMQPNPMGLKTVSFRMINDTCHVKFQTDAGEYAVNFAAGKWILAKTDMPAPGLLAKAKENLSALLPYKVASSCGWQDGNTLRLKLRYIETPHSAIFNCSFDGDKLTLSYENSFDYGKKKMDVAGVLVK